MQLAVVQRVLGILVTLFSGALVPPILVSIYFDDAALWQFVQAFIIIFLVGAVLLLPVYKVRRKLRLRDGFVIVVLFWSGLGIVGALPLYLYEPLQLSAVQAIFESISGLTTTGATVIVGLDDLPESILFYRQQLQWLGGMGIIVLAVAILPMLGIGGMQLFRAETSGPQKDNKITPRIAETAKALWYIYFALTVACAIAYWLAGMPAFDAVLHSFSTIAIGGFSTHDASIGYFDSTAIEMVAVVFMLAAGVNFALHFTAVRKRSLQPYHQDSEFVAFFGFLGVIALVSVVYLVWTNVYDVSDSITLGIFQAVSIGTTTGFTTAEYFNWPGFLPVLLLFASFVGGCAGSTGGGMKVVRVLLLFKQGQRELVRLIHPNAHIPVKLGKKRISDRVIDVVWGFFAAYVALFSLMLLLLMASGLDQVTAFSAVAACLNNLGPGLGEVGAHYASLDTFPLIVLNFAMLLGRLEIFTLLVLFTPAFWDK
ncbi:MAG: TrkH family potassium uptake protein [Pseudomonadota bacterium]